MRERPGCVGLWLYGAGGHRRHDNKCTGAADWWHPDDMFAYCDEHLPQLDRRHGDYVRWPELADTAEDA